MRVKLKVESYEVCNQGYLKVGTTDQSDSKPMMVARLTGNIDDGMVNSARIDIDIVDPETMKQFELNKEFYVDITPVS